MRRRSRDHSTFSRKPLTGRRETAVAAHRTGNALARSAAARRVPVFLATGPHFTGMDAQCRMQPIQSDWVKLECRTHV